MNVCRFQLLAGRRKNEIASESHVGVIRELKGMLEQFNYSFLVTVDVEREGAID